MLQELVWGEVSEFDLLRYWFSSRAQLCENTVFTLNKDGIS